MDFIEDSLKIALSIILTIMTHRKLLGEIIFDIFIRKYFWHFLLLFLLLIEIVRKVRILFTTIFLNIFRLQLG